MFLYLSDYTPLQLGPTTNKLTMVEYIDQNILHLTWQVSKKSSDITAAEYCGDHVISGSKTGISIWKFIDDPGNYDQLPIIEVAYEPTSRPVAKVLLIGEAAFTALKNGTLLLHELATQPNGGKSLDIISEETDLHKGYKLNDMQFCAQTNTIITCGNDGALSCHDIVHKKTVSKQVSEMSLKCLDMVNPNEVICGTLDGCVKHYDLRTNDCKGSFSSQNFSAMVSLQKNPNVNHLAIGGNDQGSLMIYDLRNTSLAVAKVSAHTTAITNIRYKPYDSNIVYSSSCDGDLFRWNLYTEFTSNQVPRKVESIGRASDPISITSFDINHLGDLLYTTDLGAIFYHKVNETYT